VSPDGLKFFEP